MAASIALNRLSRKTLPVTLTLTLTFGVDQFLSNVPMVCDEQTLWSPKSRARVLAALETRVGVNLFGCDRSGPHKKYAA
jgi:hypothetical protein